MDGDLYHYMVNNIKTIKRELNKAKLELGRELLGIQRFLEDNPQDDETFESLLADPEIHLNKRRVKQMMDNARYMIELGIPDDDWGLYDSSIIHLARLHHKNPDELMYLSYSDAKEMLKEEEY
jgi:hypothetical protein